MAARSSTDAAEMVQDGRWAYNGGLEDGAINGVARPSKTTLTKTSEDNLAEISKRFPAKDLLLNEERVSTPPSRSEKLDEYALPSPSAESGQKLRRKSRKKSAGSSTCRIEKSSHLRTTTRKAKRSPPRAPKPRETEDGQRARSNHNLVEKQYRNRLNAQFEGLLAVLPAAQSGGVEDNANDRPISKAEVLDMARQRIKLLEKECDALTQQRKELLNDVNRLKNSINR